MRRLKHLGTREAALVIVPLIISGWFFYGTYLGSSLMTGDTRKSITEAPQKADSPLDRSRAFALKLTGTDLSEHGKEFSLRPIDERSFLTLLDNSETYTQFSETARASPDTQITEDTPPRYKVSSILKGEDRTFAVINGKIYRQGDKISENEEIARIEVRRILLRGKWGERWIYVNF